jgi:hypothetical protein
MKKPAIFIVLGLIVLVMIGFMVFKKPTSNNPQVTDETELDLPINTTPLEERPFITLAPDASGRSLDFSVSSAVAEGELEYELVYQAGEVQEGVFGRLDLESEKQPIVKSLLLGSKSAGGKVTYHEGVTGGSLTVTYGMTRLKESFSFLKFDPTDPTLLSTDGRFTMTLPKTALKKDARVLTMKTFGYEKTGVTENAKVLAGPYAIYFAEPFKGQASVEIKLPAGEHKNPTIYHWDGKTWQALATKLGTNSVTTTSAVGGPFIVLGE